MIISDLQHIEITKDNSSVNGGTDLSDLDLPTYFADEAYESSNELVSLITVGGDSSWMEYY
jgi:hypothetical protein